MTIIRLWGMELRRKWITTEYFLDISTLRSTLDDLRDCDASDPRDHIYGAEGLFLPSLGSEKTEHNLLLPLLRPDYTKPLAHVLRDTAQFCMRTEKRLNLLNGQGIHPVDGELKRIRLPTWVPRWHLKRTGSQTIAERFRACSGRISLPLTSAGLRIWIRFQLQEFG
jgi:hypothetical protein